MFAVGQPASTLRPASRRAAVQAGPAVDPNFIICRLRANAWSANRTSIRDNIAFGVSEKFVEHALNCALCIIRAGVAHIIMLESRVDDRDSRFVGLGSMGVYVQPLRTHCRSYCPTAKPARRKWRGS